MDKEKWENCAGIYEKGDFRFVCVLKNGRKETKRFRADYVGQAAMIQWLVDQGCTMAVTSTSQLGWQFLQPGLLQSHISLYMYTGKRLPAKAGKSMAEALARRLQDGDSQIELPEEKQADDKYVADSIAMRNRMVDYAYDNEIEPVEEFYQDIGIDYSSLFGGVNEVQAVRLLFLFCRPLTQELKREELKEMQKEGTLPALMNLEWLLDMYEQRPYAPDIEEVLHFLDDYLRQRILMEMVDQEIIQAIGEEKAKEILKPIPHLGGREAASVKQLTEEIERGRRLYQ